jgi:bacteriocin biosynthesis cyclodehydratase domain-containing protein
MTGTYEKISDSRPRIRRDILCTETPGGVVFHNAHGGFNLNGRSAYRFVSLIVPHLNGENTVGQICAGLGEKQRVMVAELVSTLYSRGFARDVPPGSDGLETLPKEVAARFAAQIGYVDHYTGEAGTRFGRFRGTRVAVLGGDAVAGWCALSLVRNGAAAVAVPATAGDPVFGQARAEAGELTARGCPARIEPLPFECDEADWERLRGYDVVVTTGGPRTVLRLLEAGVPEGTELLPVWTFGERAVVGPLTAADAPGCWACAALRLSANHEADAAALWSEAALGAPDDSGTVRLGGPLAAMLGNLVGYEVFRLRTGAPAAETRGKIIVQDLDSLDVVSEPLLPHPRCPHCSPAPQASPAAPEAIELGGEPLPARTGQLPEDGDAALAELNSRAVLVNPHTGVFGDYADDTWEQTPIKVGTVSLGSGAARRDICAFDVHHVAGARLRALRAAAAVHAEHVVPCGGALHGAALDAAAAKLPMADPATLSIASGTGRPAHEIRHWMPAVSLRTGDGALLPAGAVRTFGAYNGDGAFTPTAAGTGVGASVREAAARGLLGALSYEALTEAIRGRRAVRSVSLDTLETDAELLFLLRSAKNLGLRLELLDLAGEEQPASVLLARAADPLSGEWRWAPGSAAGWGAAACEAVRDLVGGAQLDRQLPDGVRADTGDPVLADFAAGTLAVTGETAWRQDAPGGWGGVLTRLTDTGLDALAVPCGSADLAAGGLHVVRVVLAAGARRDR